MTKRNCDLLIFIMRLLNTYCVSNSVPSTGDSLSNGTRSVTPGEGGSNLVRRDTCYWLILWPPGHGDKWVKLLVQEGYLGRFLGKGALKRSSGNKLGVKLAQKGFLMEKVGVKERIPKMNVCSVQCARHCIKRIISMISLNHHHLPHLFRHQT